MVGRLLSLFFAFALGANYGQNKPVSDSELQRKVQDHMDVIVDESAGIVDDVIEEIQNNEQVKKAGEFVDDVNEIIDNTKADIKDHFGEKETETEEETQVSWDDDVIEKDKDE